LSDDRIAICSGSLRFANRAIHCNSFGGLTQRIDKIMLDRESAVMFYASYAAL
jgi:hypothetical protein